MGRGPTGPGRITLTRQVEGRGRCRREAREQRAVSQGREVLGAWCSPRPTLSQPEVPCSADTGHGRDREAAFAEPRGMSGARRRSTQRGCPVSSEAIMCIRGTGAMTRAGSPGHHPLEHHPQFVAYRVASCPAPPDIPAAARRVPSGERVPRVGRGAPGGDPPGGDRGRCRGVLVCGPERSRRHAAAGRPRPSGTGRAVRERPPKRVKRCCCPSVPENRGRGGCPAAPTHTSLRIQPAGGPRAPECRSGRVRPRFGASPRGGAARRRVRPGRGRARWW